MFFLRTIYDIQQSNEGADGVIGAMMTMASTVTTESPVGQSQLPVLLEHRAASALVFDECLLLHASERALFARPNWRAPYSGWRLERTAFAHWLAMTDRLRPVHTPQHAFAIPASQNRPTPTSDAPTTTAQSLLAEHARIGAQRMDTQKFISLPGPHAARRNCRHRDRARRLRQLQLGGAAMKAGRSEAGRGGHGTGARAWQDSTGSENT